MEVAGRVVEGKIKERAQARREYSQAIRQGHRASIAEEERPGVFSLRVGNLMPGDVATVQLTMVGHLPYHDGEVTFRFPLVVAPRYIPGNAARRAIGWRRNGRRYERRARRLADLAAGVAPGLSQSGAALAGDRCARAGGRPARQPVHGLWGRSRRRAPADPATGRAARPRFHSAVPAGRRSTEDVADIASRRGRQVPRERSR